jgi:hypothetical protein
MLTPQKRGLWKTILKAWPLSTRFWNDSGCQRRKPYSMINHKPAPVAAVITVDNSMDSAISFAPSQYDTHISPSRQHTALQCLGKYWQAPVQFVPKRIGP